MVCRWLVVKRWGTVTSGSKRLPTLAQAPAHHTRTRAPHISHLRLLEDVDLRFLHVIQERFDEGEEAADGQGADSATSGMALAD